MIAKHSDYAVVIVHVVEYTTCTIRSRKWELRNYWMEKEREGAAKVGKDFQSTLFVFAGFENKKFDADEPFPIVYNSGEAI